MAFLSCFSAQWSCTNPSDRRTNKDSPYYQAGESSGSGPSRSEESSTSTSTTNTTSTQSTDQATPRTNTNQVPTDLIPKEISHCSWSTDGQSHYAEETNAHLGAHTICQDNSNEKNIYIQIKEPINDSQVCLIPTYTSSGKTIYIGEPRCLLLTDPQKIYKVELSKNRDSSNYSKYAINSVMVMKDKAYFYPSPFYQYSLAPDAYIFCSQFLDQYGDPSYCQAFKSKNEYVFKLF